MNTSVICDRWSHISFSLAFRIASNPCSRDATFVKVEHDTVFSVSRDTLEEVHGGGPINKLPEQDIPLDQETVTSVMDSSSSKTPTDSSSSFAQQAWPSLEKRS